MIYLTNWTNVPVAAALGRTLLHSLWEGAAVALILVALLGVVRSPRARYGAACLAMLVILSGFVVTFARLAPPEPAHLQLAKAGRAPTIPPGPVVLLPVAPDESGPIDRLAWLAPLWLAGVILFYLRGMASWLVVRRLQQTGVCCPPAIWQEKLNRLSARLQVTRKVAVLESCLAEVPVVIGYLRPVILMPVGLLAGLPVGQVDAILLHELAHIRRYDYLVNLLQVFVEGLLFYHPAVWWISGIVRAERENCCDDLVVAATGGVLEYATALTALEQRREQAGLALAATGGSLVNRIQRLLGRSERRYAVAMPVVTAALLTVTVVTAMAALQLGSGTHQNAPVQPSAHPPAAIVSERVAPRAALPEKVLLAQAQTPGRQPAPPPTGQVQPDQILYDRAVQNIDHGNYVAARLTLNTLINTYSGSSLLPKAKLAIADSWFREGGTRGRAQAEIEYKDFILFYPNSPEANEAQAKLDSIATKQNEPDIYRKRMDKEVGHIISDEERKAFQTAIAQQNEVSRPLTAEQQRAKEDVLRNGLLTPYRKWLDQDVVYIISDEERKAFTNLRTDEEREKFVQQFWARRDPTPGTERNEFKEEIYRRIAYTNAHFSASVAGWRTDRGRIYIQYGPPDEIEAHSTGGVYQRPASEGGGTTQTYPFEQWRYRLIDGVGQNVILEFVDKDGSGDYKMTMDPKEKDNLLRAPGGSPR